MTPSDIIQTAAVIAAVGAAIVALVIAAKDRQNARDIATEDRRDALRQAHLLFELDALSRLSANRNRSGGTDEVEQDKLRGEAMALVGLLGPERTPNQYAYTMAGEQQLRAELKKPGLPLHKKNAIETQLAVQAVVAEIRASMNRQ